jgi:hypothetical protein
MMEMSFPILRGEDKGAGPFIEAFSTMYRFKALMESESSIDSLKHASSQEREQMNPHTEGRGFDSRTMARASSNFPAAILSI